MQSFEQLPSGRKEKSHVPSKDNHTWDTDATVKEVQMWPESQQMNWSEIARRHNVPVKKWWPDGEDNCAGE